MVFHTWLQILRRQWVENVQNSVLMCLILVCMCVRRCMHVDMLMWYVHSMCTCLCVSQHVNVGVNVPCSPSLSPPWFLRQAFSLNQELTDSARLAGQWAPGIPPTP